EFLALKISDIVPEHYIEINKERLAAILKGKAKNEAAEYMVKTKQGETRYVAILSAPFYQDNMLIGFQGIVRDITENKKMEIRLRESEEYYRTLVETSPDAIVIVDAGGRVSFTSQKALDLFGIPGHASIKGASILDFVEPGEIPRIQERMIEILSGASLPQVNEYRLQRRDRRPFWAEVSSAPLRDSAGRSIGLLLVCRDVSERKRIEAERLALQEIMLGLAASESLHDFLRNVHQSIAKVIYAENFFVALYNKETALFEEAYSVDEFDTTPAQPSSLEKSVSKYIFRSGKPLLLSQAAFDELEASGEVELVGTNSLSWLGVPLKTSRDTIGVMVVQDYETEDRYSERDLDFLVSISGQVALVVERKRAEAEVLREKAFLEALVETAPQGIAITDCSGRVQRVNGEFVRMFGYEADEAVGRSINDLVAPPEYLAEALAITRSTGAGETNFKETIRKKKDGTLVHVSIIGVPILIAGQQVAVYAIYSDISGRKRAEEQIRGSLQEKEVLLKEIHHRVKNNLQIISGLLTLQADQSAGKSLEEVFHKSQDRIHSIALIHEKLYRSHNLAEIAFDDYLRDLTENLFSSHGIDAGRITARYDMEKIYLTIEKAIPLGLIVNELVTNSLKHAFPGGRRGEIRIGLHSYEGAKSYTFKTDSGTLHVVPTCELVFADDGIGLPAAYDPAKQKTLGMNLVSMLAKQLQAELKVKTGPGAEFRLIFAGLPAGFNARDKQHPGGA
ncbi:MAG TPA: PAS domain S-box protein, partial [Acidobacteriota bacterium]